MAALDRFFGHFGISARAFPETLVGKFAGHRCIVAATAKCVWDDLDRLGVHGDFNDGWHTLCVNDIIMHYPGVVDHGYSNQHRWIPHWCNARRETINSIKVKDKWGGVGMTHSCRVGGQHQWPWPGHGTSTLNAVYTALALGYDEIVICGAPLDNSPHYFEPDWCRTNFEREVGFDTAGDLRYWTSAKKKLFNGKVHAMSGRTRDLLGEP